MVSYSTAKWALYSFYETWLLKTLVNIEFEDFFFRFRDSFRVRKDKFCLFDSLKVKGGSLWKLLSCESWASWAPLQLYYCLKGKCLKSASFFYEFLLRMSVWVLIIASISAFWSEILENVNETSFHIGNVYQRIRRVFFLFNS